MKDGHSQADLGTTNQVRTLFKPSSWLTKIDFINHLVLFNNVLITVLSEKSGGKTSFSALLLNSLDQQIKPVFMSTQPPCDRGDILGDIAAQLHLNMDAYTNVSSIVGQINERKAHVLLVIDDSQHLPEELIKEFLIAIKNQEDTGYFHLCLVSDYSVVATLNNLAADQLSSFVHTIELGSLNESESRTYVLQRAMAARLINKPLADNQLKQFYQLTKGNIAKMNTDLDSFILKCSTQKEKNTVGVMKRVCSVVGIAAVAGLSLFYYQHIDTVHQFFKTNQPDNLSSVQQAMSERVTQIALVPSYIASFRDDSVTQLVHNALPKKQILDVSDDDEAPNTVALVDKVIVIPSVPKSRVAESRLVAIDVVHQAQPKNRTKLSTALSKSSTQGQRNKAIRKPLARMTKVNAPPQKNPVARAAQSSGFTIQLIASHKKSDLDRFKKSNKLYSETKVRHFSNHNGNWYVLTIGEYKTRFQAQEKANKLPGTLAQLNPWVRPVSGLKKLG
jgi:septal ring-binding cell division protein DamX